MKTNDPKWLAAYKSLALPEDANDVGHVTTDRDGKAFIHHPIPLLDGIWHERIAHLGNLPPNPDDWQDSCCTVGAIRAYEPPKQVRLRVDMQTGEVRQVSVALGLGKIFADDASYLNGYDTPEGHAEARRTVAAWLRRRADNLEDKQITHKQERPDDEN